MRFIEKLYRSISKNDSLLCIGLDVDPERMPKKMRERKDSILDFNRSIVSETLDLACCYKINLGFYESLGLDGIRTLIKMRDFIPDDIPIIIDGKRGDIGNTARMYAKAVFDVYGGDATTTNPYMGFDSVKPFLDYKDRYVFVLCKTSNPSSKEIQDIKVNGKKLYLVVAEKIKEWGDNCGPVAGATYPEEIGEIRKIVGDDRIMLVPGVGTQGGDLQKTLDYGCTNGKNVIINVSRGIIYAEGDFPKSIRKSAEYYRDLINRFRP